MTNFRSTSQRVDVQFHFAPEFYTDIVKAYDKYITNDRWSLANVLVYMDRFGITTGIMSVSSLSVNFCPSTKAFRWRGDLTKKQRKLEATQIARDHPGRFGNFATLPMLDVDATLGKIAFCYGRTHK